MEGFLTQIFDDIEELYMDIAGLEVLIMGWPFATHTEAQRKMECLETLRRIKKRLGRFRKDDKAAQ